jgi:hypothetical protein
MKKTATLNTKRRNYSNCKTNTQCIFSKAFHSSLILNKISIWWFVKNRKPSTSNALDYQCMSIEELMLKLNKQDMLDHK